MVNVEQTRDENKEKYQLGDYPLILYILNSLNQHRKNCMI